MTIESRILLLEQYIDYMVERLFFQYEPTFYTPTEDWNIGTKNPHAKNGWHGVSKPHGKFLTVKYLMINYKPLSFDSWILTFKNTKNEK